MTETVTEWGVRYQHGDSTHVDPFGHETYGVTSEQLARRACLTYKAITTQPIQHVTLVKCEVTITYGEWEEVTDMTEPTEPEAEQPEEQDTDAETSQDDGEDSHVHEANPF